MDSADGGQTWTTLASELASSGSLQWNSETVADSEQAFLRLVARDAQRLAVCDGSYYILLDVETMAVVWKRL